jgi:hypothetical protein
VKYMALIYADRDRFERLSPEEREAAYDRYRAFGEEATRAGVAIGGAELGPTRDATTVRIRDGETLVTDGPYAETKEALGGYYLLECASLDDALDWAAKIPGAQHGAVEVRALHVDDEGGEAA